MVCKLTYGLVALMVVFHAGSGSAAQAAKPSPKAPATENKEIRLNGCISRDTVRPGQYNFLDNDSGDRYQLTGKGLRKFVGRRVEIVGGPPGKGLRSGPGCGRRPTWRPKQGRSILPRPRWRTSQEEPRTPSASALCPNFAWSNCAGLRGLVSKGDLGFLDFTLKCEI